MNILVAPIASWDPQSVPQYPHLGAFQAHRKFHIHEGVDLYTTEHAPVFAMEDGVVLDVRAFTGDALGHTWWNNTDAVYVHGNSGIVVYGELVPMGVHKGGYVRRGEQIGCVARVLKKNKGRPMDMLHLELRDPRHSNALSVFEWSHGLEKPVWLLDPTPLLMSIPKK